MGPQNLNPLDELRTLDQQVEQIDDLAGLKPIFFRLEEISKENPNDFQVQLAVGDIKQHLVNRGTKLKQPPPPVPVAQDPVGPPPMPAPMPVPSAGPPPMPLPMSSPVPEAPKQAAPPPILQPAAFQDPPVEKIAEPLAPPPMPPPPAPPKPPAIEPSTPSPMVSGMRPAASGSFPSSTGASATPPPRPPDQESPKPVLVAPITPNAPTQAPPPKGPNSSGPPKPPGNPKRALMMGAIAGLLIAAASIAFITVRKHQRSAAGAEGVAVEITTTPPGASVSINGEARCKSDCKISLPPGNYQVTTFLDGYEPAASGITVAAEGQKTFSLALEPQAQSLRILTDLPQGKVAIDDQPPSDLQDGQFIVDRVAPGSHTVKITGKGGEASFTFDIAAAKMPSVTSPVAAKNLSAVVVSSLGNQARVVTNSGPLKLVVNGQAEADASPSGTDLKSFQPGVDELEVGEGKDHRSVKESFGPAPMLTAFFRSDLNVGSLIVATGKEDGVRVFVNNKEFPQKTQRGLVRIQTIGPVTVRVMKEGFEQPPVQTAEVKKGTDTRLDFTLKAMPQLATLLITGGTPGATVIVDNRTVGTVGADGNFTNGGIAPGDHTVELRRDQFTPHQITRTFRAGQTTTIVGPDAVLSAERPQPAPQPANKQVTPPPAPKERAAAPAPTTGGMSDWEDNSVWRQEGGVYMHQGAAFIPYKMTPRGVFTFTVQLLKGGNLFRGGKVRWAVNREDDKNYALYEMDSKNFWAKVVVKGKTLERTHIPLKDLEKQKSFTIQIDVMPEHIVHKMFSGGEWITLDSWAETGRNFSQGKFGFIVQGNDEIGISEFKFQPR